MIRAVLAAGTVMSMSMSEGMYVLTCHSECCCCTADRIGVIGVVGEVDKVVGGVVSIGEMVGGMVTIGEMVGGMVTIGEMVGGVVVTGEVVGDVVVVVVTHNGWRSEGCVHFVVVDE